MVLAIGLVVDDAIVVLENIYRHIEDGMKPVAAAIKGAKEIGFAVIAMTLTLVLFSRRWLSRREDGASVPRVRDDAGRRGADLGLRRADADPDDVLEAPAGTIPTGAHLHRHRALFHRLRKRLQAAWRRARARWS